MRLPEESLPLNPFARVNVNSETAVKVAAQEFADLMESVEKRLGIKQKRRLNDAILSGFDTMSSSATPFPDFEIIRQEIDAQYFIQNNWSPDTLTEVVRQLTDFKFLRAAATRKFGTR